VTFRSVIDRDITMNATAAGNLVENLLPIAAVLYRLTVAAIQAVGVIPVVVAATAIRRDR
jgi:hypothetical protein